MTSPLTFGALLGFSVFLFMIAIYRVVTRPDPIDERLQEYGEARDFTEFYDRPRRRLPLLSSLVNRSRWGPRLARALYRAALPLTAAEFVLIMALAAVGGFAVGTLGVALWAGGLLGALFSVIPLQWLRFLQGRRRRAFTGQLPDMLSLLIGALRSGYGLHQALQHLVEQMAPPASEEFDRTLKALELGQPLPAALDDMVERVGSDDLEMVVLAIKVQQEVGGNLAHTLNAIVTTVRERIRIHREIRVLTAQQRITGYILGIEPIFLAVAIFLLNRAYFDPFFEGGPILIVPIVGAIFMLIGFYLISRIVDIQV